MVKNINIGQNINFGQNINCGQKYKFRHTAKFWSKIKILGEPRNFEQNAKRQNSKIRPKYGTFFKCTNCFQKLNLLGENKKILTFIITFIININVQNWPQNSKFRPKFETFTNGRNFFRKFKLLGKIKHFEQIFVIIYLIKQFFWSLFSIIQN